MASAPSLLEANRRLSFLKGDSFSLFRNGLLRGLGGALGLCLFVGLCALGWAWIKGEDTRARLLAAVPQVMIPLDWDSLGSPPPEAPKVPVPAPDPVIGAQPPQPESPALPVAPLTGLFETTPQGSLPIIRAKDGLTPFSAYRRPFNPGSAAPSGARGLVSIVIRDIGLSDTATTTAIKNFPPDITLALSAYATQPDFWQEQARRAGHEIWITLPTPASGKDPGPQVLTDAAGLEMNGERLLWALSRTTGYPGVILMDSPGPFGSPSQGDKLRSPLFARGLGLADLSPAPSSSIEVSATNAKTPYASGGVVLDRDLRGPAIHEALLVLEAKATAQGQAIGILSPTPIGYQEVLKWLETLSAKNILLVPLSAHMAPRHTGKEK